MKKEKQTEKVGMSDRAGVVIMDRDKKVIKEITSEKKNDKSELV